MKFNKILIANRSEIALRVQRSAKESGYSTIAIHSPHDINSLYVRESDERYALAGNLPRESYLDIEQIISIARKAKANAIHPGYGFLSENSSFSEAVTKADMKFIGPDPASIELLGDKTKARALAQRLGIPTPGGTTEALKDISEALKIAKLIGYPILLKAAAGGGGKGMRIIEVEDELEQNYERAKSEALGAFGDDRVYVEKYITEPRHVEFQVLADSFGNVLHLGERECTIQRRHQKLLEESPSVILTPEMRSEMAEAAVSLVHEAKYEGAGTVEFLVDKNGKYYFLEVNTRLQVEHPITEYVTGLDLVREQFHIAEGNKLRFKQSHILSRGHSIEVRIQAEDVWNDFLPSLGTIGYVRHAGGAFVRNDSALFAGLEISPYYDSLLAKLIVWDIDRPSAIQRMRRALEETRIVGVSTTLPFGTFVMNNRRFADGNFSTSFVDEEFTTEVRDALYEQLLEKKILAFAAVANKLHKERIRNQFLAINT